MSQGSTEDLRTVDDFVLSEIFYTACLETLLSAYIIPLSNTAGFPSTCSNTFSSFSCSEDFGSLLSTFGVDILEVLSCHRALINALQIPRQKGSNSSAKSDNISPYEALLNQEKNPCSDIIYLLRTGVPAMRVAYQKYVLNFDTNVKLSDLARSFLSADVWNKIYFNLARSTLLNSLFCMGVDKKSAILFSDCCNISFEALIVLPIQHITRYPIYVKDLIEAHKALGSDVNLTTFQNAGEVLKDLWDMCSAANAERTAYIQLHRLAELERRFGLTGVPSQIIAEGDDVVMRFGRETRTGQIEEGRRHVRVILLHDHIFLLLPQKANSTNSGKLLKKIPLTAVLSVRSVSTTKYSTVYLSYASVSNGGCWKRNNNVYFIELSVSNETEAILWVRDITQAVSDLCCQTLYL
ncbi:putative DNA topoisomerase III [Trypanosoma theileri]|uniref:Putative DNA topoisomerase III n=1 Tax=Trypanosoma theileri TaxID=67003 RepID=A0A1X0P1I6_9TRYP|nr:putative DNA topoisomerase III [Trypanosoma theileri]ORC90765.1 putative DNA topoisomerase III [Trypanosoma theileri]